MDEPMFYGEMVAIATAYATHPENTVLDENGHPALDENGNPVAPQEG